MTLDDIRRESRREFLKELRQGGLSATPEVIAAEVERTLPFHIRRRISLANARIVYLTKFLKADLSGRPKAQRAQVLKEANQEVLQLQTDIAVLQKLKVEIPARA